MTTCLQDQALAIYLTVIDVLAGVHYQPVDSRNLAQNWCAYTIYICEQKSCVLPYITIVLGLKNYGILLPKNILAEQTLAEWLFAQQISQD